MKLRTIMFVIVLSLFAVNVFSNTDTNTSHSGTLAGHNQQAQEGEEQIDQELYEVDQQIGSLERKKEELEQIAEQARHLADLKEELQMIQNKSSESIRDYERQIAEMKEEDEYEQQKAEMNKDEYKSSEQQAFRQTNISHLVACRNLHKQILAINDVSELAKAGELMARIDELNTEWWMILEPKYSFDIRIKDMKNFAREEGSREQHNILKKLNQLHEEDMANRQKEFDLFKERRKNESTIEAMIMKFWGDE